LQETNYFKTYLYIPHVQDFVNEYRGPEDGVDDTDETFPK